MTLYLTQDQINEIDKKVLLWHDSTDDISLKSFLNFTDKQYKDFVEWNVIVINNCKKY